MTEQEYYSQQLLGLIQQAAPMQGLQEPAQGTPQALWEQAYMANQGQPVTNGPIEKTPYEVLAALSATPGLDPNQQELKDSITAGPGHPMQDRVNALNRNNNKHGIMASTDAKGQLVLSNYVPSPGVAAIPQVSMEPNNVSGSVRGIIDQLRKATDIDTARGLQAQLNEAAAQETAKIQAEARKHAENKVGVPQLEFELNKMMELDRNSPSYFPGRGDSAVTAQARTQLNAARGAADLEAQRYLKSNVSANSLDAAIKTASMETARISRLADKQETMTANLDARRMAKEDDINFKLDQAAEGLSEQTQQAIRTLNPALANGTTRDLAANFMKGKANPAYMAAITAPEADLPKLAAQGNSFSTALLMQREGALGINSTDTEANLRQVQDIMREGPSPRLKAALASIIPPGPDRDKTISSAMADLTAKSMGTAADKALASDYKFQIAKQIVAQGMTNKYMADVNSWRSPDPDLAAAVAQAKKVTGKTSLSEVAVAFVGDSVGAEANMKIEKLINIMANQAAASKNSLFGMPDTMQLRNMLIAEQLKRSRAARLEAAPFSGNSLGLFN